MFLYNNYKQISSLLEDLPGAIAALESGKTPEDCAYATHLVAERAYLVMRKKEPAGDAVGANYIGLLVAYEEAT